MEKLSDGAYMSVLLPGAEEPYYKLKLFFEEGCQMESIRALGVMESIKNMQPHCLYPRKP